jgi:molecular chaperone IbpA
MGHLDFSPLYRSTIGFDQFAELVDNAMQRDHNQTNYPPFNIESFEDENYRITMAVAGFKQSDLELIHDKNTLTIRGNKHTEEKTGQYLYRGIAARQFEKKFQLADHIKVVNATVEDGLLIISLVREVPEALKPQKIEIGTNRESITGARQAA